MLASNVIVPPNIQSVGLPLFPIIGNVSFDVCFSSRGIDDSTLYQACITVSFFLRLQSSFYHGEEVMSPLRRA